MKSDKWVSDLVSLTGRQSKLARMFEDCIRDRTDIEIELSNRVVLVGQLLGYELSSQQCIIILAEHSNRHVINFGQVIDMRIPLLKSINARS